MVCEGNIRRQSPRNAESREIRLINVYNVDTCAFGVLILTSALAYVANYRIWNHPLQNIQTKQGSCLNFPNNEPKKAQYKQTKRVYLCYHYKFIVFGNGSATGFQFVASVEVSRL